MKNTLTDKIKSKWKKKNENETMNIKHTFVVGPPLWLGVCEDVRHESPIHRKRAPMDSNRTLVQHNIA
jgi:hypothetical protein